MKTILIGALLLLFSNILILNYQVFFAQKIGERDETTAFSVVHVASPSADKAETTNIIDSCYPRSCVDLIRQATASFVPKAPPTSAKPAQSSQAASAKEFYVTLGSGQTSSDVYEDIPGVTAYIDSTKYGKIKTVTFGASMRVTNGVGRAYVQLFNETDKHPVWFSEISTESYKSELLVSSPITLDKGNKLYKVQAKTSLKFPAFIEARVHIITE